ncbi:tRNA (guanosine(18)-2'-O)-methyltransferase [Stieleria maiorica]|uniref:tRNA (Guanosine(18)-2'-O)-methyltransferase n=1 Tax=Stieleria maiorica TaxID=2795974 RepID=A0A5B9MCS8_9BACT|nr:RNA methyltransferase [Stieleria maiorica]QEF97047.1 tRNA (guanosine(18)-2'-O)-methyltransferase [Stieleria maiorica]
MTDRGPLECVTIDSIDDPRLADFRNLRRRPTGRVFDSSHFVVEGQLITQRLIASDYPLRSVVVEDGRDLSVLGGLGGRMPVYVLSRDQMRQLSGFDFHRGFLASADRQPPGAISDFHDDPVSLALVQTTDMENLGSMVRTAAALGIRQVLIDPRSVDPFSRRAMRVSMGAVLGMRWLAMNQPADDLRTLASRGVVSLASTLASDAVSIDQVARNADPMVLVMGNEAQGLPTEVQQAATRRVTIPMATASGCGQLVDSLNVSVAAAILLYELTRQV